MAKKKQGNEQETVRQVTLRGVTDLMFDRYAGDNKTQLRVEQKLYFGRQQGDGKTLVLPAANVMSFLSGENTPSAPKVLLPAKDYKKVCRAMLCYVMIEPQEIPITRDGKPIKFNGFGDGDEDEAAGVYIHRSVARLKGGIPNPKIRPTIRCPWELAFSLRFFRNEEITEEMVQDMFVRGGIAVGLGTFRGVFGKFIVDQWK